jgi:hypothetical protein
VRSRTTTAVALIPLLLSLPLPAAGQHEHRATPAADSVHATHTAAAPLGLPRTRQGSGTSWLPDLSPMRALHASLGGWETMLHGNIYLQDMWQGGARGNDQTGSINWIMGMARRPLLGGEVGLRAMVSAEPWTISGCGYPILLATGELCDGAPIVDEQHPHDLFMELAAEFRRELSEALAFHLYLAPAGEPALGPVAFPHRPSASPNPLAPISHHWFDATHIAFGVATMGVHGREWKVEGSVFNGREPDDHRTDLDLATLDSYAGRVWWLPLEQWALQLSGARLTEAEPGHAADDPRIDVSRFTGSVTHHQMIGADRFWATTMALGRNVELGAGTDALLLESSLGFTQDDRVFVRAEWAEKAGHDLALEHELEEEVFGVAQLSGGYTRELPTIAGLRAGVGVQGAVSFLPSDLEPYYGKRTPAGFTIFASLRPAPMAMTRQPVPAPGAQPARAPDHSGHGM